LPNTGPARTVTAMRKTLTALLIALTAATASPLGANASEQTSVWLTWGTSGNYVKASQYLRVTKEAPAHFWALHWQWAEDSANGGYLGIQTDGVLFDGQVTDVAIFSVWGATGSKAATGSTCQAYNPAGENGAGLSCRRAIAVTEGHRYYLQVTRVSTRNNVSVYSATVKNMTTRQSFPLGTLTSPGRVSIREVNNFIEDFSTGNASCAATSVAAATFTEPRTVRETPRRSVRMAFGSATLGSCERAQNIPVIKRGTVVETTLSK